MGQLNPIQILLLGLAGAGGFADQRRELGRQKEADTQKASQQEFENSIRSGQLDVARGGLDLDRQRLESSGAVSGAGGDAAGAIVQALLSGQPPTQALQGLPPGFDFSALPPEIQKELIGRLTSQPMLPSANQLYFPMERRAENLGPLNDKPSAIMREQRLMGGGPEAYFEPADVAKIYRPNALKEYNTMYPEGSENRPDFNKFFMDYMKSMQLFAGTQTTGPNNPPQEVPPPGTQWQWIDELGDWAPVPVGHAIGTFSDQPAVGLLGR